VIPKGMVQAARPQPRASRLRPMRAVTLSAEVDQEVRRRAEREGAAVSRIIDEVLRQAFGLRVEPTPAA
jgi:hypothetical protein